jgi:hypothetical protein
MKAVIVLDDARIFGVRQGRRSDSLFAPSPGYTLIDASGLLTGNAAAAQARRNPRCVSTSHWDALDESPLPRPFPRGYRHADLVYAQLEELWSSAHRDSEVDDVVLVVPGWYTDEQLGLLAGIARECELPLTCLVDLSLACCASNPTLTNNGASRLVHADIHLRRASVSRLVNELDLEHRDTVSVEVGLVALRDTWARTCADVFVRETRFDPFHAADTEQRLYDALDEAVAAEGPVSTLRMESSDKTKAYSVEIAKGDLARAVASSYDAIIAAVVGALEGGGDLSISERLLSLPGFRARLERALPTSVDVVPFGASAAAEGVLSHRSLFPVSKHSEAEAEGLTLVTRLPLHEPVENRSQPDRSDGSRSRSSRIPTHVLHAGVAHALAAGPFALGPFRIAAVDGRVVAESSGGETAFLNERPLITLAYVSAGDRLRGTEPGWDVELIEVEAAP